LVNRKKLVPYARKIGGGNESRSARRGSWVLLTGKRCGRSGPSLQGRVKRKEEGVKTGGGCEEMGLHRRRAPNREKEKLKNSAA